MIRRYALTLALLALPASALAQVTPAAGYTPPDDTQAIKIGAVIFADWTRTLSPKTTDAAGNTIQSNAFTVTRAYINVTGAVSHRIAFRITPDITRETGTSSLNGSLTFRLKYAYAQFNLDDWTGNWKNQWVRVGIQQTPYIDAQESVYRYRFQGTTWVERDGGMSSADAGLSYHTNLPGNYGDVHVGVYNGEGYSKAEANNQKALMVRGTVRPMPAGTAWAKGLRVSGFVSRDHAVKGAAKNKSVAGVWYESRRFNAAVDYMTLTDQTLPTSTAVTQRGWSAFVTPFFKEKGNGLEALIRYDHMAIDRSQPNQTRTRGIYGLAYWFPHPGGAATAAVMLDYEQVRFRNVPALAQYATQQRLTLHGLINF